MSDPELPAFTDLPDLASIKATVASLADAEPLH